MNDVLYIGDSENFCSDAGLLHQLAADGLDGGLAGLDVTARQARPVFWLDRRVSRLQKEGTQ